MLERNPETALDLTLDDPSLATTVPELAPIPLVGVPFLDETVFFHRPTATLIGADIALCACHRDHWYWRLVARVLGCYETLRVPPDVRLFTGRSDETARALERMLALPMERLLLAHADPVEDRPAEQLAEAWRFVLG